MREFHIYIFMCAKGMLKKFTSGFFWLQRAEVEGKKKSR